MKKFAASSYVSLEPLEQAHCQRNFIINSFLQLQPKKLCTNWKKKGGPKNNIFKVKMRYENFF